MVDSARCSGASLPGGFLPSAAPRPIDAQTAAFVFLGAWLVAQIVASIIIAVLHGPDSSVDPTFSVTVIALLGAWTTYLVAMWMTSQRAGSASMVADYGVRFRWVDLFGLGVGALGNLVLIRLVYLPLEAIWPGTFNDDRLNENARRPSSIVPADRRRCCWCSWWWSGHRWSRSFFYRGLLQRSLASRFNDGAVLVSVAVVFGSRTSGRSRSRGCS